MRWRLVSVAAGASHQLGTEREKSSGGQARSLYNVCPVFLYTRRSACQPTVSVAAFRLISLLVPLAPFCGWGSALVSLWISLWSGLCGPSLRMSSTRNAVGDKTKSIRVELASSFFLLFFSAPANENASRSVIAVNIGSNWHAAVFVHSRYSKLVLYCAVHMHAPLQADR